jgi:alkanesulfonate monooxygenase SsuD/methylene tetrahydromethanopterin reductase-like flavin-dependent oxidoreductase (luciferase family)
MRVGIFLNYAGGFAETVTALADYERAGADIVFVPEAYSFDAVSQLGYIAARTERMQIAEVWGTAVAEGRARRDPALGPWT